MISVAEGHEGGRGKPARVHHRHHRAWFEGRQAGDGRPVRGTCGRGERTAAEGALPAGTVLAYYDRTCMLIAWQVRYLN